MDKPSDKQPALFVPIRGEWLVQAFNYFKNGKDRLYFVSNAKTIGSLSALPVRHIYFKMKGDSEIKAKAEFIEMTTDNPVSLRLNTGEPGKYYYGFCRLRWMTDSLPLSQLHYFGSDKLLRNDVPGACIIVDPDTD